MFAGMVIMKKKKKKERGNRGREGGRKEITNVGQHVEKLESLYTVSGNKEYVNGKEFGS